jgi:hypothetical protein
MGLRFRRSFGLGSKGLRADIGTGGPSGFSYDTKFGRRRRGQSLSVLITGCVLGFIIYVITKAFF